MISLRPEFFDIFGFIAFVYISLVAACTLWFKGQVKKGWYILLLLIGVGGMIVDGIIVYSFFIK